MNKIIAEVTDQMNFYEGNDPIKLAEEFGTPLYVYNERILRERCRELKNFVQYPKFEIDYSAKANSSLALLQIVKSEGLKVDAVSLGEIYAERMAGFEPEDILFICNNISGAEMRYAIEEGVLISIDSISQLQQFGELAPGSKVAVRFNPGIGAGHSDKVVTGGKHTKFGVNPEEVSEVKELLHKYQLNLVGINQHIGSLYMEGTSLLQSMDQLFEIAKQFEGLEFVDFGGGLGIPYHKEDGEAPLNLDTLGRAIEERVKGYAKEYGTDLTFRIEPGRFVAAECGVLLGTVHAVKSNQGKQYAGCDIGFNVLARPVMYDSYHGIEVYRKDDRSSEQRTAVNIVGNICESGDILAKERMLPEVLKGDVLGVLDAGAYGHVMSSNYNHRLRPAEVLIREDGSLKLIRERDTLEDLVKHCRML